MRPKVRERNPGKRLRRRVGVRTIRDIGIKHDITHVVSVPLKSNGSPLAGHVDLMPGPGRLQTRPSIGAPGRVINATGRASTIHVGLWRSSLMLKHSRANSADGCSR